MQPSGLRSCNERDDTTLNRSDLRIVIGCCRNRKEPSHIAIRTVKIGGQIYGNRQRGHQRQHGFLLARERKNC
jgi:hypothetical protein